MSHKQTSVEQFNLIKRRIFTSLWNDGAKAGSRTCCEDILSRECSNQEVARILAIQYRDHKLSRLQRAVFIYKSGPDGSWTFGFFVSQIKKTSTSRDRGDRFINMYCIEELDSKQPINTCWLRNDLYLK